MSHQLPTIYAYGELQDGTTWANVRVTLATKIQYERSAKANRWDPAEDDFLSSAFMSWHAAKAAGHHHMGWDEFLSAAVDAGVTRRELEETDDPDQEEDPTRPVAGTE